MRRVVSHTAVVAAPSRIRRPIASSRVKPALPAPAAAALPPDGPAAIDAVVTVIGANDILPDFMTALVTLGCKPNILPADVVAPDTATTCLQNLPVPTPLEQSQILRAMENIEQHVRPFDPIESAVFRLLLAHDVATLKKLLGAYETYLGALSDLKETLNRVY